MAERIILVGGPRMGKSTFARGLRAKGIPTYCSDPLSLVKDPEQGVTYMREGLEWSEVSRFVADTWIPMGGPYCIDGVATVRALRKVLADGRKDVLQGVRIIRFTKQYDHAVTKDGQRAMAKAIESVWIEIAGLLPSGNVEYR